MTGHSLPPRGRKSAEYYRSQPEVPARETALTAGNACGVLPLERADVDDRDAVAVAVLHAREAGAALVGGGHAGVVARVDGRAAGQQGVGLGLAAVVGQRAELRVDRVRRSCPTMSPLTPLVKPVPPVPSPIRLWPWLVKPPDTSGPVPAKSTRFRAMIVFRTLNVPPGSWKTPPPVWALFSTMVQLSSVASGGPDAAAVGAGGVAADGAVGQRSPWCWPRCRRRRRRRSCR